MSPSEVAEALEKAARLRRAVAGLDPEPPPPRSLVRRLSSFVIGSLAGLVVLVLVVDGVFAYRTFHSGSTTAPSAGGPTYSNVQIFEDRGYFAGSVSTTNPFAKDIDLYVTVDLYDGDQQVGEVSGSVTLKPDSTSVVELSGFDDFRDFTESRVHLGGWPDPAS